MFVNIMFSSRYSIDWPYIPSITNHTRDTRRLCLYGKSRPAVYIEQNASWKNDGRDGDRVNEGDLCKYVNGGVAASLQFDAIQLILWHPTTHNALHANATYFRRIKQIKFL